jgi:hypothetical protein
MHVDEKPDGMSAWFLIAYWYEASVPSAAKESTTLTKMIEEGLTLRLRRRRAPSNRALKDLPVSGRSGGFRKGVDGTSNRSLFDAAGE